MCLYQNNYKNCYYEKTIKSWKHTSDVKLLAINKLYIVIKMPFLININENNLI